MPPLSARTPVSPPPFFSRPDGPKRPGLHYVAKLACGAIIALALWIGVSLIGMMWRAGEEMPLAIGIASSAFSQYEFCNTELKAVQEKGKRPSLAMRERSATCFADETNRSPESVNKRVEAALAFEHMAMSSSRMDEVLFTVGTAVTPTHRKMLAAEGARMDPATSSGVGIMLGLSQLAMWQEESLAKGDTASAERARVLARSISRMGIKGMIAESERAGTIDRRVAMPEWIASLVGAPPRFFGGEVDATRQKVFMRYWSLWHPVAATPDGGPNFPAIEARRRAGAAWVATMPGSDAEQAAWLSKMERLASANAS